MSDNKLIRSELAYWDKDKTLVELFDDRIRFTPVGEKPVDIRYATISSCKRYIKELLITSKGTSGDSYDVHYIPVKFENKDIAGYYYHFIADRVERSAAVGESETSRDDESKPVYTIPCNCAFAEGVLYIFNDHFSFRTNGQGSNIRVHYLDVLEVTKNFGSIRFKLGPADFVSFQVPKAVFLEVYRFLDSHVRSEAVRSLDTEDEIVRNMRTGIGHNVDKQVIKESFAARDMDVEDL
ncbi:hypothetical protein [Butyrivibrio sp. MC2013]|uniref:hypothetical protein n=1 Tax=Butyrivibrio sp. MC2013 TaxID=1280686 RepID=UPI0003F97E04|nr:hypothetical protein [Butyrivibrio sp. MC2013]